MNVLDLFSGIGGFSLGLERAGLNTLAFCEIDKDCHKVLKKHWPMIPIFNDVSKLSYRKHDKGMYLHNEDMPHSRFFTGVDIQVLSGGFPCQDISTANTKGKGIDGERSGLWKEYCRLIEQIRPRYAILENVPNLRSRGLAAVLKDLWEIGYDCEWHIISASSLNQIHRRERIWIIAYPHSEDLREQSGRWCRTKWKDTLQSRRDGQKIFTPDPDHLRLWRAFATEEERREWWAETTSGFSDVFRQVKEIEPTICRGNDGFPIKLDRSRRSRIKQLGNAVVPQIPELIGREIMRYEMQEM